MSADEFPDDVLHAVPLGDIVDHHGLHCVCGPVAHRKDEDGVETWMIVHQALDGRQ